MKVAFVSNYINHHQIPFSNAMYSILGTDYVFIQTEAMEEERLRMGWGTDFAKLPYLKCFYEAEEECKSLIRESDVVIFGGTDDETYVEERLKAGKVIFRYSERLYKSGQWKAISPRGLWKKYHDHTRYQKAPVYLLCAGAYVPSDFHIVRAYTGKMYKWGYFPEIKHQDVDNLMSLKRKNERVNILWAARFIDWKHPEVPVLLAERLKKENIDFTMTMIGGGDREEEIRMLIADKGLEESVALAGYRNPGKVREYMEQADIYLVTSDYKEGWGAVVNEAMNSGCAVVASHAIGASPYMITHNKDGVIYRSGDMEDLTAKTGELVRNHTVREKMGREACDTVEKVWNGEVAAKRLLKLCGQALNKWNTKEDCIIDDSYWMLNTIWEDGPCSGAEIVKERHMYNNCINAWGNK